MKFNPYAYQMYCISRLLTDAALGLYLDMGLGKTVITLTAINDLRYNRFLIRRALVIAPKKVAEATWSKEAAKWDHLQHMRIISVLGSETKRIRALMTPGDVWVINRENVPWLVNYYRNCWPFDTVICDEFSSFKSHDAKRFKSLTWVRPHIERFVGLTGTPAPNGLMDLWAQLYLLDQGQRLEQFITHYREKYFDRKENQDGMTRGYMPKPGADEVIQQRISDICISMQASDYLDLPECINVTVPVILDSKAKAAYRRLERQMLLEVDGQTINAGTAAVLTNKLLQICNGAAYDENRQVVPVHDCKIEAFMELVEGLNGSHALVFYNFQHDLDRLQKALHGAGLRVALLEGPAQEDAWNRGEIDILLAHPASCAYGLNLQQGGHHVIWFGLNWSLELYQQANKRLHRQGQTERVIVHHLVVDGGVDEDVMEALEDKGQTQDKLLAALKARIERAVADEHHG